MINICSLFVPEDGREQRAPLVLGAGQEFKGQVGVSLIQVLADDGVVEPRH